MVARDAGYPKKNQQCIRSLENVYCVCDHLSPLSVSRKPRDSALPCRNYGLLYEELFIMQLMHMAKTEHYSITC